MKIIEQKVEITDETKPLIIIPIGNIEIGAPDFNKKAFEKTLEYIKNTPNAIVMHF